MRINKSREIYFGVKNLFNWTPARNTPFLLARSNDPFDKQVIYDAQGNPIANLNNPYALTFDAAYVYAPNQIRTFYIGLRY
jgi:outer membrane receptor for ferrienterochelin and colicins